MDMRMARKDLEYEYRRPRDRGLRASDRDREAVLTILRQEYVAGRITADEFQERLDRCLRAKTYGELDVLVADFPHDELERSRRRSFRPAPFIFVPVLLIALLAVTSGRVGWIAFPIFFFVVRPLVWHSRGRRGPWGPPPLPQRSNRTQPFS
jgi:hypothetical protein